MVVNRRGIRDRVILAIGTRTIERPRELQIPADGGEHEIVHVLYALRNSGLVAFKRGRNIHAPGINLTDIHLTKQGMTYYRRLR